MKNFDIIYNTSLKQIQGINYVNNSFVLGKKYFAEKGISLNHIFSPDGVFRCQEHDKLDCIGENVATANYQRERKLRLFLKRLFSSKTLMGCIVKIYFNIIRNAKKTLKFYYEADSKSDYILFQDTFTAYFFLKKNKDAVRRPKTVLLLHCSDDPIEQGLPMFPGFFRHKHCEKWFQGTVEFAMQNVDKVVFLSKHAANSSYLPENKKTYVFNGIEDIESVTIQETSSVINLVTVASVIERKGQGVVIEALSKLSPAMKKYFMYHVIGGGTELPLYKHLSNRFGTDDIVKFYGARNDVSELLKQMDVFILPSLSEGMPMSIIEAMRQGLYILATPVGGIPEMIKPEYGIMIKRNPEAIAGTLIDLIRNRTLTLQAKQASRKAYEDFFTLRGMVCRYSDIFLSL